MRGGVRLSDQSVSKELDALCQAWAWHMQRGGAQPPEIAAEINARFGKESELVTAETVGNWLLREEVRRADPILSIHSDPDAVAEALRFLSAELTISRGTFDLPDDYAQNGRAGAILALWAIQDFLSRFQEMTEADLGRPLRGLWAALLELENGASHPMLTPKPRTRNANGGRPRGYRPPIGQVTLVKVAVVAMEAAMNEGLSRTAASQAVAGELHRLGYALPGLSITAAGKTIAVWRDEASVGAGSNHPEAGAL